MLTHAPPLLRGSLAWSWPYCLAPLMFGTVASACNHLCASGEGTDKLDKTPMILLFGIKDMDYSRPLKPTNLFSYLTILNWLNKWPSSGLTGFPCNKCPKMCTCKSLDLFKTSAWLSTAAIHSNHFLHTLCVSANKSIEVCLFQREKERERWRARSLQAWILWIHGHVSPQHQKRNNKNRETLIFSIQCLC